MSNDVIRNLDTGLFMLRNGEWTKDGRLAQGFPDEQSAIKAAKKWGIKNADLVSVDEHGEMNSGRPLWLSI